MQSEVYEHFKNEYIATKGVSMKDPVAVTIRLPQDVVKILDAIAGRLERSSRSSVCASLIQTSYLDAAKAVDLELDEYGFLVKES